MAFSSARSAQGCAFFPVAPQIQAYLLVNIIACHTRRSDCEICNNHVVTVNREWTALDGTAVALRTTRRVVTSVANCETDRHGSEASSMCGGDARSESCGRRSGQQRSVPPLLDRPDRHGSVPIAAHDEITVLMNWAQHISGE
jgi:hypothetical protein